MNKGTLFIITAPSGAGKTSLIQRLLGSIKEIEFSVSCTTRPQREGEVDGKDYHFIGMETFLKIRRSGGFLEWAEVFGDLYGTPANETEKILKSGRDIILDIDVQGASQIRRKRKDAVFIFILPPDYATLRKRLEKRKSDSKVRIRRRLKMAKEDVREFKKFQYIVINDKLERASEELCGIIRAERARTSKRAREAKKILETFS